MFAPAGAVREPFRSQGIALLTGAGYHVVCGTSLEAAPEPFAAGTSALRLSDWQHALDSGHAALLPARGGYGTIHLLPHAPLGATATAAPLWIGASDLTVLQTALLQQHGLVTFYGPMPCGQLSNTADTAGREAYLAALSGAHPHVQAFAHADWLVPGYPEGELRGGCLSVLAALCGTPWQLDARDALVLIEDIGEHPFRIERMLRQLHLAGALNGAAGLLFGRFPDCVDRSGDPTLTRRVIESFCREIGVPSVFGLDIGHGFGALPVPLGTLARFRDNRLELLESPYHTRM